MRRVLSALLLLSPAACSTGSVRPLVTVSQPAAPPISVAEGELFRCPAPPVLAPGAEAYEDLEGVALRLRDAYDSCRDLDERLIALATKPATSAK
jgi:hypothetical protein